ncbi:unnamed protein product, partial [Musa textilis]
LSLETRLSSSIGEQRKPSSGVSAPGSTNVGFGEIGLKSDHFFGFAAALGLNGPGERCCAARR